MENKIYSIHKEVDRYSEEPHYGMYISTNNCSFEILINDMPIIKYIDNSGTGLKRSYYPVNWHITQSGDQKIEIKLLPGFNQTFDELHKTLQANSGIVISIVRSKIIAGRFSNEDNISMYESPNEKIDERIVSTFEGEVNFEDTFIFRAEIPYHITTLENSEILFSTDEKKMKDLTQQILMKYHQIRNIYLTGEKADLAEISYNKEKRIAQQLFLSKEEIKDRWDNDYQFRTDENLEFYDLKPIENYKLQFYGNGKIVCLEKINNKKSALWGGFKRKDKDIITTTYILIYLHRPKESNELVIY